MKNAFKKILGYIGSFIIGIIVCLFSKFGKGLLSDRSRTDGIREHNKQAEEAITRADERIRSAEKRSADIISGLAENTERLNTSTEQLERAGEIIADIRKRGTKKAN